MKVQRLVAVSASVFLASAITVQLSHAGPFDLLKSAVDKVQQQQSKTQANNNVQANRKLEGKVDKSTVQYAGYSKNFLEIKKLLEQGDAANAYALREKILKEKKKTPNMLFSLEQALIALDANQGDDAIKYFDHTGVLLDKRQNKSVVKGFFSKITTEIVRATGFDEFGQYEGEPFERILMLNFKSIAYMLDGDRRAYNVTRRAIDWQNQEKKAFDKKIQKIQKEIKKKERKQAKKGNDVGSMGLFALIKDQYKKSESTALQVPSAFVNPFGFYMAGIVQEFDSYDDASLRDNARISYNKALQLNPGSKIIKQAVNDIKKRQPKDKRLVQIVVANGFAPEKKVLELGYNIDGSNIPVKLTMYEPDESLVHRVEVQDSKGKRLAQLGVVADIDAITLRHQYDSLSEQHLRMTASIIRSVFESKLFEQAGALGKLGKQARDNSTNPDMRSWMSMPKQILAARLYLPRGDGNLQLVSFDKKGKVLVRKKLVLDANSHNFVYARSLDKVMYTNQSKSMWVAMR